MKLTLRELFLLVVIAAIGCGWWQGNRQLRYSTWYYKKLSEIYWMELDELGYTIERDGEKVEVQIPERLRRRQVNDQIDEKYGFRWDPQSFKDGDNQDWRPPPQ